MFFYLIVFCALTQSILAIDLSTCGQTKGCYRSPPDCLTINNCTFAVSFTQEDDLVRFELAAPFDSTYSDMIYVTFGMSQTQCRGEAFVVACTHDGNSSSNGVIIGKRVGFSLSQRNASSLPEGYLEMISNEFNNDVISCQFTIKSEKPASVSFAQDFDHDLFLMLAKGNTRDGLLTRHVERDVSGKSVSLLDPQLASPTLIKCHGI